VGGCKDFAFSPKLRFTVGADGRTAPERLHAVPDGADAEAGSEQSEIGEGRAAADAGRILNVVNRACTLTEYRNDRCRKAEAGSAVARTPLLKDPLRGGVSFVRHPGRPLPDLMVALRGEPDIDLVGRVTIPGGTRLATNFDTIPDAPVSKFTLNIVAASHGPLGVSTNLQKRAAVDRPGPDARAERRRDHAPPAAAHSRLRSRTWSDLQARRPALRNTRLSDAYRTKGRRGMLNRLRPPTLPTGEQHSRERRLAVLDLPRRNGGDLERQVASYECLRRQNADTANDRHAKSDGQVVHDPAW
jgi:hypothetical protein